MKNNFCLLFFILLSSVSWSQFDAYKYTSKIQQPSSTWHKIQLEESVLGRANDDLSDIRIIQVKGKDTIEAPYLIQQSTEIPILFKEVKNVNFQLTTNKETKKTYLSSNFNYKIPLTKIKLEIEKNFDYKRLLNVYGSMDSISPENLEGATLIYSAFLNSDDTSSLVFDTQHVKHLILIIDNNDNPALNVKNFVPFYKSIPLTARFEKTGDYFLCYGNPQANFPEYDILYFQNRIPKKLDPLTYEILEKEISSDKSIKMKEDSTPIWLWIVVSGIVILLLIFTLRMLKTKS